MEGHASRVEAVVHPFQRLILLSTVAAAILVVGLAGAMAAGPEDEEWIVQPLLDINDTPTNAASLPDHIFGVNGVVLFSAWTNALGWKMYRYEPASGGVSLMPDVHVTPTWSMPYPDRVWNPVRMGDFAYFLSSDGRLRKTDGTSEGTIAIRPTGGTAEKVPYQMVPIGDVLFFPSHDEGTGYELWKTDGTPEGTTLVKDIRPGTESSFPRSLVNAEGTLFFTADDGIHGRELWVSDGTPEGTRLVADVSSNPLGAFPYMLFPVGGIVYFPHGQTGFDYELWKSDGTPEGTMRVKDIQPGTGGSDPQPLANMNGILLFYANTGEFGAELWRSDGTEAGTTMIKDINPGNGSSNPRYGALLDDGTFLFGAKDKENIAGLWRTDGTTSGTLLVKATPKEAPHYVTRSGSRVFFSAGIEGAGIELWVSDGTTEGTMMVKDIKPGSVGSMTTQTYQLADVDGILYFQADDGVHGAELWRSDGTPDGTFMVSDFGLDTGSSNPGFLRAMNDVMYIAASTSSLGRELWRSDGTPEGTRMVIDLAAGPASSSPDLIGTRGDRLLFTARATSNATGLWSTDGTAEDTAMVWEFPGSTMGQEPVRLIETPSWIYLAVFSEFSEESLWKTDGTTDGTSLVKEMQLRGGAFYPVHSGALGDHAVFAGDDRPGQTDSLGFEPWISDGTGEGTHLLADLFPNTPSSAPSKFTPIGNSTYFTAYHQYNQMGLFRTDGTTSGTQMLLPTDSHALSGIGEMVALNEMLIFTVEDGTDIWRTDGTPEGTVNLSDNPNGPFSSRPYSLVAVDGQVFFFASVAYSSTSGLWRTDGTPDGTRFVHEIHQGSGTSGVGSFVKCGNSILFAGYRAESGQEIWRSDGTPEGTVKVIDTLPGYLGILGAMARTEEHLFFSANNFDGTSPGKGTELYAVRIADVMDDQPPTPAVMAPGACEGPFEVTLDFGQAVRTLRLEEVQVTNGTADGLLDLGDGVYTFTVVPAAPGIVSIRVPAGVVRDMGGNLNMDSQSAEVIVDLQTTGLSGPLLQ